MNYNPSYQEIELDLIIPNPIQPRKIFENIDELAQSIKTQGLIQPISVKKIHNKYMIISGERRFKACQLLNLKTISAHIIEVDEHQLQEMALIENIQREDLTDVEKAKFISQLWNSGKYKKKQDLANAISKTPAYISKAFSCLKLDTKIIEDIEANRNDVPISVLDEISRIKDKELQVEIYKKYIKGEIIRDEIRFYKNNSCYNERDLHIILSTYLKKQNILSKTILHEESKINQDINQKWIHPDMIGVEFLQLNSNITKSFIKTISQVDTFKLISYEIKKNIKTDTELKKAYFQAVSNSSWANYGYLVALNINYDDLKDEMQRLNQSFGIGVIELNSEPNNNKVLFQAKNKNLDFATIGTL